MEENPAAALIEQFELEGQDAELLSQAIAHMETSAALPITAGEAAKAEEDAAARLAKRLSDKGRQAFGRYLQWLQEELRH